MFSALTPLLGVIAVAFALFFLVRVVLHVAAKPRNTGSALDPGRSDQRKILVVMVHGLAGLGSLEGTLLLVASNLPDADRLVIDHDGTSFSNLDCYSVADAIEQAIHDQVRLGGYSSIVLFGHSAGAALLRKAFVWAHGHEEDRERFGRRGKRFWVDRVDRFVLLAGMNRGWSVDPKPREMTRLTHVGIRLGVMLSRFFGVARFAMALRSGAPFIADTRIQWIRIARSDPVVEGQQTFPQVIQLIGSKDDLVAREDGQDLLAARGTVFKTLPQTGHRDICIALAGTELPGACNRRERIAQALLGQIDLLEPDRIDLPPEDRGVTRIVYIVHGIRDYGNWTDVLRSAVESRCRRAGEEVVVVNTKYGYFPMLPFLTYSDRQINVRRFMDQYTEDLARYPNANHVDFVGHSNGTYLLASALQHYATMRVRRVFFAGSVVPKHYPWTRLVDQGRVQRVVNVVATGDWVVALFPKLFEQIADLRKIRPVTGWLDLGAAGFRGFLDSGGAAVDDLKFARGAHSTGVDILDGRKLEAIAAYVVSGEETGLDVFETDSSQNAALNVLSNVTPVIWFMIVFSLCLGALVLAGTWWLVAYIAAVATILKMF